MATFENRPQLSADPAGGDFPGILEQMEAIAMAIPPGRFCGVGFAEDTQDQAAPNLQRVDQFMAELGNRTLFFSLWWKDLDDAAPSA